MRFNKLHGSIKYVSLSVYNELISSYVNIVKKVEGVKSIVQIGSFSTPGLRDIDIIVIVDDLNPPKWDEISIKKILRGKNGYEVIAHDVFVYPFSLSKYIDGLFYIDKKVLLYGQNIGGYFSKTEVEYLKLILSFEYTVHRLESLILLTSLKKINVRNVLLFISTLRHTNKLLSDFNIITKNECDERNNQIELLRNFSINSKSEDLTDKLNSWIIPSFEAIYRSILMLNDKLGYNNVDNIDKKWILNYKKLVFEINNAKDATSFFKNYDHINKFFSGKLSFQPMPSAIRQHINYYKNIENSTTSNDENKYLKNYRYNLALSHSTFINSNKYPIAKSYVIIEDKIPKKQDIIKKIFLRFLSIFFKYR